jgi:hypothetical protein
MVQQVNWHTVIGHRNPKFMVKGHVLAVAYYPDSYCRFLIEEVRCFDPAGEAGIFYRVRDAHTVTDAELVSGKRSQVVASGNWADVERYCDDKLAYEKSLRDG